MKNAPLRRPVWTVGVLFALWTLIGLAFASQLYLTQSAIGTPVGWGFAVKRALADWYVFAFLSWPSLWLAKRFPIERAKWGNWWLHFAASALFSLSWMVFRAGVEQVFGNEGLSAVGFQALFQSALVKTFFFNLLIYWVIISVSFAFGYYQKFHERELRASELEKRLAQAKLQALQMQLNPHFLFNTLHGISSLMHRDVEAADTMISQLSDLLRHALDGSETQEVSLEEELHFLQRYLAIEKTRFGERLDVKMEIDPGISEARVPTLILQPLVENAIRHGIEPHARPGQIRLDARRQNGQLVLEVRDNGGGLAQGGAFDEGVGISNTRERLHQLYGDSQSFKTTKQSGRWCGGFDHNSLCFDKRACCMTMRVLIVDDEPLARERVRKLLQTEADIEVIGECSDGQQAIVAIREKQPDLVFLDVQMPEVDGFGVLNALRADRIPAVIFVTAHDKFALQAFEVHALDYLLKPFDRQRFQTALARARKQIQTHQAGSLNERLTSLLSELESGRTESKRVDRLSVKSEGRVIIVKLDDIDWIEAADNYVNLHVGTESHLLRETMTALEGRLPAHKFMRISRSAIVNVERIKELQPMFHGEYVVLLRNGPRLTLSRTYRDKVQELLGKLA